jgi:hypothetical protein
MKLPTLQPAVIEALRSAGATEEMIAAAVKAAGEFPIPHPGGRPRKHANEAERAREYRNRKKRNETSSVTADDGRDRDESGFVTPVTPVCDETSSVTRDETQPSDLWARIEEETSGNGYLWARLDQAARGHADPGADVEPIRGLLDQGCDFEADVLPTVARMVPDLPRPLKNWGAQWLVREILATREPPLAGHRNRYNGLPPALKTLAESPWAVHFLFVLAWALQRGAADK